MDPGDNLSDSVAGAIALNTYESESTWYSAGAERIRVGTLEVDGSGEHAGRPSASVIQEVHSLHRAGGGSQLRNVVCAAYDLYGRRGEGVHIEEGVGERWWWGQSTPPV